MKNKICILVLLFLLHYSSICFSQNSYNVVLLPDPVFYTHHIGIELEASERSRLGVMVTYLNNSNRPTFGQSNSKVTNNFRRILIPWTFTKNKAWDDSFFATALVGLEGDNFKTNSGSKANSTFINLAALIGYQWFWNSGFNVSISYGRAVLFASSTSKDIVVNENDDVIEYLNKNTKTNNHGAFGLVFGWAF